MKQKTTFSLALDGYKKLLVVGFLTIILLLFSYPFSNIAIVPTIIQICSFIMLIGIIYEPIWTQGTHDANYFERGLEKKDKLKGLKAGLIMIVPSVVTLVLLIICKLFTEFDAMVIFAHINAPFRWAFTWIAPMGFQIYGMNTPVNFTWTQLTSLWQIALCGLYFLIIPIVCHVSYTLGLKRIDISEKLIYKNDKKKNGK